MLAPGFCISHPHRLIDPWHECSEDFRGHKDRKDNRGHCRGRCCGPHRGGIELAFIFDLIAFLLTPEREGFLKKCLPFCWSDPFERNEEACVAGILRRNPFPAAEIGGAIGRDTPRIEYRRTGGDFHPVVADNR